ncbi:calmodulin-binding protein 60 C-like [Eucalyptus grandis]|uniref:calmodulin-binding protein 60 C-like n=1 Tax=Eucalyptus grandis TaxID=71139 RepID=UPI00192EC6CE|nr:calmodulin-binding protein 60 C-like [Eucalyptus grandis]
MANPLENPFNLLIVNASSRHRGHSSLIGFCNILLVDPLLGPRLPDRGPRLLHYWGHYGATDILLVVPLLGSRDHGSSIEFLHKLFIISFISVLHSFLFVQQPNPSKFLMSSTKAKKIMSTQKRALPSTSSDQASLLKRPRNARKNQTWHWSEGNLMPRSWLTEDDVRRVVREELERAKSDLAEYRRSPQDSHCSRCSCIGDALKDDVQQACSTENAVKKPAEAMGLANIHPPHLARANVKSTVKNDARNLRLQLRNKLSLPLFTEKKLEGEGGARISVALIDADTGDVVTSGPEASIKLDVVVLEGDFNKDDEENWAPEDFDSYVVKEREGKGPLLKGKLQVKLKAGVGELGDLMITDNSSWNRSKSFRIGLKVASRDGKSTRIREAKTDAFPVRERRTQGEEFEEAKTDPFPVRERRTQG